MKLHKDAIVKELLKRQAYKPKPIELDQTFAVQNAFILDNSRYIAAQCSRRAGKTNGLAIRFFKTLERHPGSQSIYLSLTRDSARDIMWPVLQELNDIHKIGCEFTESKLTMFHPNGSELKLIGADQKNFIKRLKGRKYPGVGVDEAQDFSTHLQSLIDDVLTPSISDYADGWLAVTGTPGPVPQGYFFDITHNRKFGYSFHNWTLLDNPYMPDPQGFIADLMAKREWQNDNPTLMREWRNNWVLDVEALWIKYTESVNHFQELPELPAPHQYTYALGIDLGFKDSDAIAVIAWSDLSPVTYLVEEVITAKQGITGLVDQVKALQATYKPAKMVIDEGGLGKKIAEELRRQHSIPVHQADKARKQENVAFLNDALRLGRFKAKGASKFAQDSYLVQIDWEKSRPDKIVVKKKPHSDIIDAVLYVFKESPAYSYVAPVSKPKYGTKEWAEAEQESMFEAALDHHQELAEVQRRIGGYGEGE